MLVADPTAQRTVFVDYFYDTPTQRVTRLVDYAADVTGEGLAYRVGDRLIKANNDVVSAITGFPAQMRENWSILTDPRRRKLLARALIDNSLMTQQRRKALFSILLWGTLFVWLFAGLIVGIVNRDALTTYQSGWSLFFYSLGTSLFLPTPFEILLSNAVEAIGVLATVLIAAFAKTVGSWLVLMMGDKANEGLDSLSETRPLLGKIMGAMEAFARKYGYFAIFVLFAIPFMTDTAPLFVLALLNMKKAPFLAVTFAAIVVRSLLFIYAGDFFAALF